MFDQKRIVFFSGLLEGENLSRLTGPIEKRLSALSRENPDVPVTLCITSPGGQLVSSFGFFERIILFGPKNIHTIALDDTSSASLFLYITGRKRFVTPHTTFFLHRLYSYIDDYAKNIASACGQAHVTPDYIMKLMTEKGTELTAEDAISMGLAHEMLSREDEQQLRAWRDTYQI